MLKNKQTQLDTPKQTGKNISNLPGPKQNFLVGNLPEFEHDPLAFMTKCSQEYGEIVPIRLAFTPALLLSNPKHIEQVLKNRELFVKPKLLKRLHLLLGQGLLTSEGDTWFRERRLAQPVFQQKKIADYGQVMVEYTEKMLETWQDGETREIADDMMRLTFNIVMKTLFSSDVSEEEATDIRKAMRISADWFLEARKSVVPFISDRIKSPSNVRYKSATEQMDKHIYRIINQRRASGENPGDLLSMMMQVRDEDDGSQMNDKQLRDAIATIIFAGHETSANTLAWIWTLLSQNPEAKTKLQQELKEVLGQRSPTVADLPSLRYTNMVIKESIRLYPVVWNMISETSAECEIDGYRVPAGYTIIMSQWVMQRSERYFEQAEMFKPERWGSDLEKQLPKGVYVPFGDGPRICIGKNFALMETALLLATIAQKFELALVPDQSIVPQPTITLQPKNGVKAVLKQRHG